MRKFISIVFMFVLILTHKAIAQEWWNVGSAGFSDAAVSDISIAIDGNGTLYAAYPDCSGGWEVCTFKLIVKKYYGSTWVDVGSPGFSAGGVDDISIAFDENGTPYVAYVNADTYKANVMKYNGSSWVIVGSADFSADDASDISFAIDGITPYIAYSDRFIEDKATVMKFNGTSWVYVGSAGFSAGDVNNTSLAIDGDGTLYVAYRDGTDDKANVMKYNGSGWEIVGSAGFSPGAADGMSIAIDGSGTLYVAYADGSGTEPSYKANVMKYNGSGWEIVGLAGFSPDATGDISIAIDGSGTPYVAYKDAANANKATVMRYSGGNWANVGLAGFSAGEVYYTSLEISANGTPIVGYMDSGNSEKATVMKYSVSQADPLPVELSSFTASTVGSSIVLNWQTATEVNNYGFEVERTAPLNLPQGETSGLRDWEKIGFVQGNGNSNSPKEYSFTDENPPAGNLQYRLKQIDTDGQFEYYGTIAEINLSPTGVNEKELPKDYALLQNYPNPFNPATNIVFRIKEFGLVTLKIYDVLGNEISTLVNENKEPGEYNIKFDGSNLSSGIYYYKLTCGEFSEVKKLMLMK